jgi:hypothetical protein
VGLEVPQFRCVYAHGCSLLGSWVVPGLNAVIKDMLATLPKLELQS